MKSKILVRIGALVMIVGLLIAAGNFVLYRDLDTEQRELRDKYLDDEIDKEAYDKGMGSLHERASISETLGFVATWLIYFGLLLITVSIYIRIGKTNRIEVKEID